MGFASRTCYKDILPFASMVLIECIIVGGNTLFKSATSQDINSYVFTTYVFIVGFMFLVPCAFIVFIRQRRLNIPPLKVSIVVKLFVLSLIGYFSQIFGYVGIKYSSPTLSSVMSNLAPAFTFILAFFFRMEKLNLRSYTSQAKIVGTVVSISGALVATLYNGTPVTVSSDSSSLYWIIGGILLASQNFLLSFVLVSQEPLKCLENIPLEAWTTTGISALASRVGKPLIMDAVTTSMCKLGVGRIGFARVLVEVSAKKELPNKIEVVYRNGQNVEICRKVVEVLYDWKPPMCKQCCVFGHDDIKCGKKEVNTSVEKESLDKGKDKEPELVEEPKTDEGFKEVRYKKNKANGVNGANGDRNHNGQNVQYGKFHKPANRYVFQPKAKIPSVSKNDDKMKNRATNEQRKDNGEASTSQSFKSQKKTWTVNNVILEEIQRTSNKFAGLDMENVNDINDKCAVGSKGKSIDSENVKEAGMLEEEDVLSDDSGIGRSMNENEVKGIDKGVLGDY